MHKTLHLCFELYLNVTLHVHFSVAFKWLFVSPSFCDNSAQFTKRKGKILFFMDLSFSFLNIFEFFYDHVLVLISTLVLLFTDIFSFLFVAVVRTSLTQASKAADQICTETKIFEFFLSFWWWSSTPVVLLNYHFKILSWDNVWITQSKTSDD